MGAGQQPPFTYVGSWPSSLFRGVTNKLTFAHANCIAIVSYWASWRTHAAGHFLTSARSETAAGYGRSEGEADIAWQQARCT